MLIGMTGLPILLLRVPVNRNRMIVLPDVRPAMTTGRVTRLAMNHHLIAHQQEKVLLHQDVLVAIAVEVLQVVVPVILLAVHLEVHPDQVHLQEAGDNSIIMI